MYERAEFFLADLVRKIGLITDGVSPIKIHYFNYPQEFNQQLG